MKATHFEFRYQTLVHQFIVAAAFLTYLIQPDDIVWRFVKDSTAPRELERSLFALATLLIAIGAVICTWARAWDRPEGSESDGPYRYLRHPRYLGDLFYAIGLGSLVPTVGFTILVAGEALRVSRLIRREEDREPNSLQHPLPAPQPPAAAVVEKLDPMWGKAFRQEAVKWGLFLTMLVFVITLKDRLAEVLACASFLVGLVLNVSMFRHSPGKTDFP